MPPSSEPELLSKLKTLAAFAEKHPFLSSTLLAVLILATLLLLAVLAVGTICGSLDDSTFSPRVGALIRIGKRAGSVLKGSGPDIAIALFGEDAVLDSEEKEAKEELALLEAAAKGRSKGVSEGSDRRPEA